MKKYKNISLKLTPQRLAILEYLEGNKDHPSASDIYKAVSERFPTMSFATVYNTLKALKGKENIQELTIDPDKKRFDPNMMHHHHLICIHCRKIIDIDTKFELGLSDTQKHGFELTGNHIDFYGVCPECITIQDTQKQKEVYNGRKNGSLQM
jgi:Fur family peroxide stress response transcriptional regulator